MLSVTQRINGVPSAGIKGVKQPRGGYVPPKMLTAIPLGMGEEEIEDTDFSPALTGVAVDYLTRFMLGANPQDAFHISLMGAKKLEDATGIPAVEQALGYCSEITGLDVLSIKRACQLSGYDVCFRAGLMGYKPAESIDPDGAAIGNIRLMVERSLKFFEEYGPVVLDAPTFEGGYTEIVSAGDGDFLTEDTLWDFKVSKKPPTNKHTLQALIYFLMGKHSIHDEFDSVENIGFYNPRLNTVYRMAVSDIAPEVIEEVESEVIGY